MFELSVARKYLIPRVRQLSVSVISIISVFVIATVVWLSIVFFSAQEGIERSWTEKMVALTSPIRLTPTAAYYKSYYYQVDAFSHHSNYSHKTLRQKLLSPKTDPYDPLSDPSLPDGFPRRESRDIVKETMDVLRSIPRTTANVFETAQGTVSIRTFQDLGEQEVSTGAYLMSFDKDNARLEKSLLTPKEHISLKDDGILLPKGFMEAGVKVGDVGYISYKGFGATAQQENRAKIKVEGFYDPGILPVGGKVVLISSPLIDQILSASLTGETSLPTGIAVDFSDLKRAPSLKDTITKDLHAHNLAKYWKVETYSDYSFTKEIFQQMKSDKNLFSLISIIIMIVASSNIISMLIILVHDKRKEIAILRALGATKKSIGSIFGLCGFLLGAVGSFLGAILAILTLHNLPGILSFLGKLQGFEVLSSTFYANTIPTEVSASSLFFVITIAAFVSCFAGIVPAIQASRINTSEALRNE